MRPAGVLPLQPWMTAASTRSVMAALTAGGAAARFVGGCVRNSILGLGHTEIDIATAAPPSEVMELLRRAGIKAIPTGIEHGTVTAVADGRTFEITTLRKDVETMGRHARVAFTDDWVADAERRDFTMNALYCDADGALYDPTDGLGDLKAGRVRFVGDPARRIQEDYLRILRFFRFFAHYGRPPADVAALNACRAHVEDLRQLSAERIAQELRKLLAANDPTTVLRLMQEVGALAVVLPEAVALDRLQSLTRIDGVDPSNVRRLAAVSRATPADAAAMAERLKLSTRDRDRLVKAAAVVVAGPVDAATARRLVYQLGVESFVDQVYLRWAEAGPGDTRFRPLLDLARTWRAPEFALKGDDVLALGIDKGPEVGRLLRAVEEWWIAREFTPARDELLGQLRRLARGA